MLVILASCGDNKNKSRKRAGNVKEHPWDNVTDSMMMQHCQCVFTTMRKNKPSTTEDSCWKIVSAKFEDTLKALGYYDQTSIRDYRSSPVLKMKPCKEMYALIAKESEEERAKKLIFSGEIVSQKQRPNGEVEIVLINKIKHETKTFISKTFFENPAEANKKVSSYEIIIEYEVRRNPTTKQEEYFVKKQDQIMLIEAVRSGD